MVMPSPSPWKLRTVSGPRSTSTADTWPLLADDDAVTVIVLPPDTVTGLDSVPLLNTTRALLAVSGLLAQFGLTQARVVGERLDRAGLRRGAAELAETVRGGGAQLQRRRGGHLRVARRVHPVVRGAFDAELRAVLDAVVTPIR
ncbi:hypothetical protein GCM10018954_040360 [Kutzneria kofuensis]